MEILDLGIDGLDDVEQIGRGGSSRVYRARQVELDRLVALKVLKAGDDPSVVRRFDRERKAMGRLSLNEGIVPVYSSGLTDNGEPYLIMPYYEKGSLQDRIAEGPVPWTEAVGYVAAAANTMTAAHEAGVVHLDLKPANILLTSDNAPRIADFGIAKLVNDPTNSTGSNAFTPTFSAPEVLLGETATPAADVYGLAATLWSLISGRPPFRSNDPDDNTLMAVVGRVVHQPIEDLRDLAPDAICRVIEMGMTKDPSNRYPTAGAFAQALSSAVDLVGATAVSDDVTTPIQAQPPAGNLRFDEPVPPRFLPATDAPQSMGELFTRYSAVAFMAVTVLAAFIIVVALRAVIGSGDDSVNDGRGQVIDDGIDPEGASTDDSVTVSGGARAGADPSGGESTTTSEIVTTTTAATTTTVASSSTSETSEPSTTTDPTTTTTTTESTTTTTDPTTTTTTTESTTTTTEPTTTTTTDPTTTTTTEPDTTTTESTDPETEPLQ